MIVIPLQSGSNGNCIYIETDNCRLLIDAGISAKCAAARLAKFGRDIHDVHALLITHEHSDHIRCAGIFSRKFLIPVYLSRPTFRAAQSRRQLGSLVEPRFFTPGQPILIRGVTVESIPTPHDAVDGSVFVVDDGKHRVGIFTDFGHVFPQLEAVVSSLNGILLESNYDTHMLENGSYPYYLKKRISGEAGHINNHEAANLLRRHSSRRLEWACLAHLSKENNHPDLALETHQSILGKSFPVQVASRMDSGPILSL